MKASESEAPVLLMSSYMKYPIPTWARSRELSSTQPILSGILLTLMPCYGEGGFFGEMYAFRPILQAKRNARDFHQ